MKHIKSFRQWFPLAFSNPSVCQVDIWEDAEKNVVLFSSMGFGGDVMNFFETIARKVYPKRTTRDKIRWFIVFPHRNKDRILEVDIPSGFENRTGCDQAFFHENRRDEFISLTGHEVKFRKGVNWDLFYPPGLEDGFIDCLREKRKRAAARDINPECESTSSADEVKEQTAARLESLGLLTMPDRVITYEEHTKLEEEATKEKVAAAAKPAVTETPTAAAAAAKPAVTETPTAAARPSVKRAKKT